VGATRFHSCKWRFLAYIDVFWIMGGVCLLAIVILFFAKKTKPGQAAMGH